MKELIDRGADTKSIPEISGTTRQPYTDGPPLFYATAYAQPDK